MFCLGEKELENEVLQNIPLTSFSHIKYSADALHNLYFHRMKVNDHMYLSIILWRQKIIQVIDIFVKLAQHLHCPV